jgi:hypothetical protein
MMLDEGSTTEVKQILEIIERIGHKLELPPICQIRFGWQVFQVPLPELL